MSSDFNSSFFTFSGRQPMDLSQFELNDTELDEVTRLCRDRSAVSLAALYHLFLLDVRRNFVLVMQIKTNHRSPKARCSSETRTNSPRLPNWTFIRCRAGTYQSLYRKVDSRVVFGRRKPKSQLAPITRRTELLASLSCPHCQNAFAIIQYVPAATTSASPVDKAV